MRQRTEQDDVYHIGASEVLLGAKRRVLDGAVLPIDQHVPSPEQPSSFGWVSKGLRVPGTGGLYVVEFLGKSDVRIAAYIDLFGRAFSTDEPLSIPPAREPDVSFAKYSDQPVSGEEAGCVLVRGSEGDQVHVAQYRAVRNRYTLFDSWYDFGERGFDLTYEDAMARAYLAFAYRPSLGALAVPERGLLSVFSQLKEPRLLVALRAISADVREVRADPALKPPALVQCLSRWLSEAGLDDLNTRQVADDALRLVRTTRYADTYYVALQDDEAEVSRRSVWALESALNRFLLTAEALGDNAAEASDVDCARWDAYLIEAVALQHPSLGNLVDASEGVRGGAWDIRCSIAAAIERLRLPVRIDADVRVDVAAGVVSFEVTAPDGSLMPLHTWREEGGFMAPGAHAAGSWTQADFSARAAQAQRYALHLGLVLTAIAFEASASIGLVNLSVRLLASDESAEAPSAGGEFPAEFDTTACVQVAFDRDCYERFGHFEEARAGDPFPPFRACSARWDVEDAPAFKVAGDLASSVLRCELPETCDSALPEPARSILGTDDCWGVRINYDAAHRRFAESLADRIVRASGASEAIRIVRAAQDEAGATLDDRAAFSCTRLMAALAQGELDMGDQNAIVSRFLGDDRCLVALGRAKTLAQRDPMAAVDVLVDAIAEAAALDGFVDGSATVFRAFDSYAARMLYNRARHAGHGAPERAIADAGKRVELASDSFYLCHLEIVRLLEHSFERADEALRYGHRAIQIAPATAAGYRQLGRAYMLVGDMENAASTLFEGLRIAVQPTDIAMAYYQLGYVLWKAGRPQEGAVCYLKSLMAAPVVALQATVELQELMGESGIAAPVRDTVDRELGGFGIPVAPTDDVVELLGKGAAAAVDAGLFPIARNLLSMRLRYRPDDALVSVLRSLEE